MAKIRLHPLFKYLRGTIKGMVFRLTQDGETSAYMAPDMSGVEWSPDQEAHREHMAEAYAYASQAVKDPEIREIYLQMSRRVFANNRPYNMAVSDYCKGNNLLGDKFHWDVERWRAQKEYRKRKKRGRMRGRRVGDRGLRTEG